MIWSEQILCAPSVRFNNQFRQNKMNVQVENLDTHEARLTVDIEPSVIEQTRREVAKNLSKAVRVPGFRAGHGPHERGDQRHWRGGCVCRGSE